MTAPVGSRTMPTIDPFTVWPWAATPCPTSSRTRTPERRSQPRVIVILPLRTSVVRSEADLRAQLKLPRAVDRARDQPGGRQDRIVGGGAGEDGARRRAEVCAVEQVEDLQP